jgi:hypothetical protein
MSERHVNMSDNENLFGELISSYSRAQAIRDGVLVDLSEVETVKRHWKFPFACTDTVYGIIERAIEAGGCDLTGIMHDIAICAKAEAHRGGRQNVIFFKVCIGDRLHDLKLHIGPGDTAAPVLTLMLPHED